MKAMKAVAVVACLLIAPSAAAQRPYQWNGSHACIVESSVGALALESATTKAFFEWTNADKSFFAQIRVCGTKPAEGWELECADRAADSQALKIAGDGTFSYFWNTRFVTIAPFVSWGGAVFATLPNGKFQFNLTSETSDKAPAWFMASGTCTPFTSN